MASLNKSNFSIFNFSNKKTIPLFNLQPLKTLDTERALYWKCKVKNHQNKRMMIIGLQNYNKRTKNLRKLMKDW